MKFMMNVLWSFPSLDIDVVLLLSSRGLSLALVLLLYSPRFSRGIGTDDTIEIDKVRTKQQPTMESGEVRLCGGRSKLRAKSRIN